MNKPPVQRTPIPYGRHAINEADQAAVLEALKSDFLTGGPEVAKFEQEFAGFVGGKFAVALCNATAALHLALRVAGIGKGDRVVTSPNTFLASANCAAFVGATADFSDIDPVTYNLCPKKLEAGWKEDCRAVIPVAYGGQPANLPEIARIVHARKAVIIDDGCHGTGGSFVHEGKVYKLGGNPWADMTVFSFHPIKSMTTGEGGMLVTDNPDYAERARQLRNHGMIRDETRFDYFGRSEDQLATAGPWCYEMQELGYNYRITDFQCALGRSQLSRLPDFMARRRAIVSRYNEAFAAIPWLRTPRLEKAENRDLISWHLYTVLVDFEEIRVPRATVIHRLRESGIGSQVLYIPVYLQPWYQKTYGYAPGKCPVAEQYYKRCLSLPLYPDMTDADVDWVVASLRKIASVS